MAHVAAHSLHALLDRGRLGRRGPAQPQGDFLFAASLLGDQVLDEQQFVRKRIVLAIIEGNLEVQLELVDLTQGCVGGEHGDIHVLLPQITQRNRPSVAVYQATLTSDDRRFSLIFVLEVLLQGLEAEGFAQKVGDRLLGLIPVGILLNRLTYLGLRLQLRLDPVARRIEHQPVQRHPDHLHPHHFVPPRDAQSLRFGGKALKRLSDRLLANLFVHRHRPSPPVARVPRPSLSYGRSQSS